jgi:CubicO group peptidase (beta-lactamase class C family)
MRIVSAAFFFALALVLAISAPGQSAPEAQSAVPITGRAAPGFEEFERAVVRVIQNDHIPGAAIAFVKDGRLVYARGFGWADEAAREPIEPTSVFRLASISKSLTGIGILKLVQDKQLCMEQKVFTPPKAAASANAAGEGRCAQPILHLEPVKCAGCKADPRIYDITVQDLMQMSGGWITSTKNVDACGVMTQGSGDWASVARAQQGLHMHSVPTRAEVIRFGISHKLNFTPGTCYSYANFNFMILGQVIEQVTGRPYEEWMQENILRPMGVTHLAHVQASLRNGVPEPNPLNPQSMALMVSRPANPKFTGKFSYWTDGWDDVRCAPETAGPDGCALQGATWVKGGDFTVGTITTYASWSNGVGYVLLFNSHTPTNMPDINRKIIQPLVRTKTDWPDRDLFQDYR